MIDIHSHILYGIDDGSRSREESINILNKMYKLGFTDMVATPHYITGSSYKTNNINKMELINELNSSVKIYLGNEIYIDSDILSLLENGEMAFLNNSKYVLVELPRNGKIIELNDIIFKLRSKNIIPIIAHPERYIALQDDNSLIPDLIQRGALFEVNFESSDGKYGKDVKKLAIYMLKNNMVHFLASDIHHEDSSFFDNFDRIKNDIIKLIGIDKFQELTIDNPNHVIKNEIFEVGEVTTLKVKKGFFRRR